MEPIDRPEMRISVRVEPELYEQVQKIADDRFEGRFSMAARAAFRLLITTAKEEQPEELALAS